MAIELMLGSNLGMVHITSTYFEPSSHCPEVNPYSAVYFYQYSSPQTSVKIWTTRFTIASATGMTSPANPTQSGLNYPIPWQIGNLVDFSKAVPAPNIPGGNISSLVSAPVPSAPSASPSSILPNSLEDCHKHRRLLITLHKRNIKLTPAGRGALPLGLDSCMGLSAASLIFATLTRISS